jgi:hypothetical protein
MDSVSLPLSDVDKCPERLIIAVVRSTRGKFNNLIETSLKRCALLPGSEFEEAIVAF